MARPNRSAILSLGFTMGYLSLIVLIPLAAVIWKAGGGGWDRFWAAVTARQALSAIVFTVVISALITMINAVMGTVIAWVMVRDDFPGKTIINSLIDLPFALPTIVAGLTLIALYGPNSPIGVNFAYTRPAVALALLFVTLPFVVRSVQPVLIELDTEMEEAASSLGAGGWTTFRRVVFPNLMPAVLSGVSLSFARAVGEFGSVVLISGNIPFKTEVAAVQIFSRVESGDPSGAAAVAVVLLAISFAVLLTLATYERWRRRYDR